VIMQKFLKTLASKKFLAAKCPECGYVYAPPRNTCCKCWKKIEEKGLIEIPGAGTLASFTVGYVELDGKANWVDLKKPKVIGAIKLDGANSLFFAPIDVDPKDAKIGMKIGLEWNAELKGGWKDIKAFKPV
jgi:uncharacterized protein